MNSVLLSSPIVLIGYGISLVLFVVALFFKKFGVILNLISLFLAVGISTYGLIIGVTMEEVAIVLFVLVIVNCIPFFRRATK